MEESFGVIPCRKTSSGWEFLLIKDFRGNWGFPKGHSNPEETPHQAAERELLEEIALHIQEWLPKAPLILSYTYNVTHTKKVTLFLAKVIGEPKPDESEIKAFRWVGYEEGESLATFPETKTSLYLVTIASTKRLKSENKDIF